MPVRARLLLFTVLLLPLVLPNFVYGLGGVTLSAYKGSSVSVDGVLGAAEWSDARHLSFGWVWNNSSLVGGGDLWVKNNGTSLLVAVSANGSANITQGMETYLYSLYLLFDNDNNGVVNNNEDGKAHTHLFSSSGGVQTYQDLHYNSTQGVYTDDRYKNGTAAGSHTNPGGFGGFTWEFSIPMTSIYPEDFNLPVNTSIGFEVVYAERHYSDVGLGSSSSGWAYWEVSYPNGLPGGPAPSANGWAVIVRTDNPVPISDNTPPTIGTPVYLPSTPTTTDHVVISFNVTDTGSGVKNATVYYTTDNWVSTNQTITAAYDLSSSVARATMPLFNVNTVIKYYLVAFDNAGNKARNDNAGSYYSFTVGSVPTPPSPSPFYLQSWLYWFLAVALAGLLMLALLAGRRRKRQATQSQ